MKPSTIPVGQRVADVELARPDGSATRLSAEVDRYLIIQVLRYHG